MDSLARDFATDEERYTYADYYLWNDNTRWELIEGRAYAMAPGPNEAHQSAVVNLLSIIKNYLNGKKCRVYIAPFDVRLNGDTLGDDADTVVQPDLLIICDLSKIDERGIIGAPDLVAEILSPSTTNKDKVLKFKQYQSAGVREYWIIDPAKKTIQVNLLKEGIFEPTDYSEADTIKVNILSDLSINAASIFEE